MLVCCMGHDHRFKQPEFSIDGHISLSAAKHFIGSSFC